MTNNEFRAAILQGIPDHLPPQKPYDPDIDHAPVRRDVLSEEEKKLAIRNALRYVPPRHHGLLAREFAGELGRYGRIYMYRYRPEYPVYARSIHDYPHRSLQAAAIMLMLSNNLDPAVAQHPHELITYGGNGAVFQNWAQYRLTMKYLAEMTDHQTLVLYSGHPLGLFPSHPEAPRVVVTNGMVIPSHSTPEDYERMSALGVTQYGQMTAGSFMYIGPQGIVHGTTITVLNAGRMKLAETEAGKELSGEESGPALTGKALTGKALTGKALTGKALTGKALTGKALTGKVLTGKAPVQVLAGKIFVTSGLGGMSGAQPRATVIAGGICVVAEVNPKAIDKRYSQGWVDEVYSNLDALADRMQTARRARESVSLAFHGNVVDLWEYLADREITVELGSDQTSLHNPYSGGYYPAGYTFEDAQRLMTKHPEAFREAVRASLRRHVKAINRMVESGMYFWDYGNAFLLESGRAGAEIFRGDGSFRYQSYVQAIMGPLFFDYGFGPFRWVCTSSDRADLEMTDRIALEVLEGLAKKAPAEIRLQLEDNIHWIREAGKNNLVVGSQARILYADSEGRIAIARAFNDAIRKGSIGAPVVLGRDHHDVSGTDSPYRETSHIYDGSSFTADMSVQNVIGDAFRGATWVSLHNGGGVGWGEVINGGFGMVLDGSEEAERRLEMMLHWDVNNGIARRSWARNPGAISAIRRAMEKAPLLKVTLPSQVDDGILDGLSDRGEDH